MDATLPRPNSSLILATLVFAIAWIGLANKSQSANYRTRNFIVQAPNGELAEAVGKAAERFRDDLAEYWTGQTLPPWPAPCPIRVVAGANLAAQGVTTYNPAPVRDFQMEVIGTPQRILDSVLPHEVTHTVLATYFGRPLPRWADEGICTTVEHESERAKHEAKLREFLSSRRGIAMNRLFLLTEYPSDVLPMYAQGYSVCRFLISQQGPRTFIQFLKDYMQHPSWTTNVKKHYEYDSLAELQRYWLSWVEAGSGEVTQFVKTDTNVAPATALASAAINRQDSARRDSPTSVKNRGKQGWYHRADESLLASTAAPSTAIETLPLGQPTPDRSHTPSPTSGRAKSASWTPPPSVLSSGRYSVATPQSEHAGSLQGNDTRLRGDFPVTPSRYLR